MPDALARLIAKEFFTYPVKHGPGHAYESRFPYVTNYFVPSLSVPHIVPDNTYRPEVVVAIDFNHTFVLSDIDYGDAKIDQYGNLVSGKRPVSRETLQRAGRSLRQFFEYYFEYILSYGKDYRKSELFNSVNQLSKTVGNDEDFSLFINYLLNYFITSVSVSKESNNIGTATISIRDNYNLTKDNKIRLFFDKTFSILNQIFAPMLPIMVWARGRIYKDWVFPLFDGYITSVTDSNAAGFTSLTINCRDALELARISQEMVDPSIMQVGELEGKTKEAINIFSKPFYGVDHFDIVQGMFLGGHIKWDPQKGRILVPREYGTDTSKNKRSGYLSFDGLGNFGKATNASADVWGGGATTNDEDQAFIENGACRRDNFSLRKALNLTKHTRRRFVSTWGSEITPYRIWNTQSQKQFEATFDSRLSIVQSVADIVYYNLYVDGFGNVRYHPMRLSTDFLKYDLIYLKPDNTPVYHERFFPGAQILGPEEIISTASIYNVEELITFLRLSGNFEVGGNDDPEPMGLIGQYSADNLLRRFGYRRKGVKNELFTENLKLTTGDGKYVRFLDLAAREFLLFSNAQLYTRQDNMIFRPELEVASPLYVLPSREIFYVNSLTHTINIGGEATTSVNSNFGRSELMPAPDLYTYILKSENIYRVNKGKDQLPELPGYRFLNDYEKKVDKALEYYDALSNSQFA